MHSTLVLRSISTCLYYSREYVHTITISSIRNIFCTTRVWNENVQTKPFDRLWAWKTMQNNIKHNWANSSYKRVNIGRNEHPSHRPAGNPSFRTLGLCQEERIHGSRRPSGSKWLHIPASLHLRHRGWIAISVHLGRRRRGELPYSQPQSASPPVLRLMLGARSNERSRRSYQDSAQCWGRRH